MSVSGKKCLNVCFQSLVCRQSSTWMCLVAVYQSCRSTWRNFIPLRGIEQLQLRDDGGFPHKNCSHDIPVGLRSGFWLGSFSLLTVLWHNDFCAYGQRLAAWPTFSREPVHGSMMSGHLVLKFAGIICGSIKCNDKLSWPRYSETDPNHETTTQRFTDVTRSPWSHPSIRFSKRLLPCACDLYHTLIKMRSRALRSVSAHLEAQTFRRSRLF